MNANESDDDDLLQHLQRNSFGYFVHEVNRRNGLVLDKTAGDWPASIAAVGMALSAYPVGVERGFMARADAAGLVLGARVPIILTSRADSLRTRMASCAVAVLFAHARRNTSPLPEV